MSLCFSPRQTSAGTLVFVGLPVVPPISRKRHRRPYSVLVSPVGDLGVALVVVCGASVCRECVCCYAESRFALCLWGPLLHCRFGVVHAAGAFAPTAAVPFLRTSLRHSPRLAAVRRAWLVQAAGAFEPTAGAARCPFLVSRCARSVSSRGAHAGASVPRALLPIAPCLSVAQP